jgi:SAM-dependent methyltransferase
MQHYSKVNLGCGEDIRNSGFLNIDVRCLEGVDFVCDIRNLDVIDDDTFEYVVAQNVFQYIPRTDMLKTLIEWKRVIKPEGHLEIRLPNDDKFCQMRNLNNISPELGISFEMINALRYGQQLHEYDIVLNAFTPDFLNGILVAIGFKNIRYSSEDFDFIMVAQK